MLRHTLLFLTETEISISHFNAIANYQLKKNGMTLMNFSGL